MEKKKTPTRLPKIILKTKTKQINSNLIMFEKKNQLIIHVWGKKNKILGFHWLSVKGTTFLFFENLFLTNYLTAIQPP